MEIDPYLKYKKYAKSHNGEFIELIRKNYRTFAKWKCHNGHEWEARIDNMVKDCWCIDCQRFNPEELYKIIEEKGGKLLSFEWENVQSVIKIQCENGHIWETKINNVKNTKRWCKQCQYLTIEEMQEIAKQRGGKCLSENYINRKTKLLWECRYGHQWKAVPFSIKNGSWCPNCNESTGEVLSREIFNYLFEKPFIKVRPKWLTTERNGRMELDGYCKELKIAFEYNGAQHYKFISQFHSEEQTFELQKQKDEERRIKCQNQGIILIEIPYTVKTSDLYSYIYKECKNRQLPIIKHEDDFDISQLENYYNQNQSKIEECKRMARERQGECLSEIYINNLSLLKWKCDKGHIFETTFSVIQQGSWCKYCNLNKPTIDDVQEYAKENNGICLSSEYKDNNTLMNWECKNGHKFQARLRSLKFRKRNRWCPYKTCE